MMKSNVHSTLILLHFKNHIIVYRNSRYTKKL